MQKEQQRQQQQQCDWSSSEAIQNDPAIEQDEQDCAAGSSGIDALAVLADAALAANSEQFSLPHSMSREIPALPFDERLSTGACPVPPPKALCHLCGSRNTNSTLIQCDFCALCYHLDCLTPPLSSTPKDKWMCPAHVEHILDQKFAKTLSLQQRLRFWNKYARQPVDEYAVKLSFLKKASEERKDSKIEENQKFAVPECIKELYQKRWNHWKKNELPAEEEQDAWFSNILRLQKMQAQLDLCQQSCPKSTSKRDNVDPKETEASGDPESELAKTKDSATSLGFDVTEQDDIYAQCAGLANFIELPFLKQIRRECLSLMENAENRETRIIGLLAYQRLEQLLCAAGYKQNMNRLKFEQS
ncbi:unnamed protein product [Gongylonema pulchrum]|uniref:PHD-type domain-containing protein n=1 Tax=Gongylonema pulchrum TaxID=637853 RepID=A0A3P7N6T3_9BILA|nr:unnamed protein product [Gongylonema pulchrum]